MVLQRPLYGERDKAYFQRLDDENIKRAGSEINYFSLNRGRNVDPLYDEPMGWSYIEFCLVAGHIEFQEVDGRDVSVRDEGEEVIIEAKINISKIEWNGKSPVKRIPKAGDVMEVQEQFWDIVKGNSAGNAIDRPDFTGYQLELRKRLKFIAQRKVMPRTSHILPLDDR